MEGGRDSDRGKEPATGWTDPCLLLSGHAAARLAKAALGPRLRGPVHPE